MSEKEYIRIKKQSPLPNLVSSQRQLNDSIWKDLVFYHLLTFYKEHNNLELRNIIQNEQNKELPRTERAVAKFMRKFLNNNREFNLHFTAYGETTNDEDIEGNYDLIIDNTYWNNKFCFECKNLDKTQDLINKYVFYKMTPNKNDGGVYRYFNGKYAQDQDFGGMIGFILDGDVKYIISKVIEKMKLPFDIEPEGNLLSTQLSSIEGNAFTFDSIHTRKSSRFMLHHLLFTLK